MGLKANLPHAGSVSTLYPRYGTKSMAHIRIGARTGGKGYARFQHIILVQASTAYTGQVWDTALPAACPTPPLFLAQLHGY